MSENLLIERLGGRGEGIAQAERGRIAVPYALPGETVRAVVEGERGRLEDILNPSPHRVPAFCPYYGQCGGCAVQTLPWAPYAAWKRGLLVDALTRAGLAIEPAPLVDAHGAGRRRATFHARYDEGRPATGFMRPRSHEIVAIEACPILSPDLASAAQIAHELARALSAVAKPLDILVTGTLGGLDVDLRGCGPLPDHLRRGLVSASARLDLARLSNHGEIIVERRAPRVRAGRAEAVLPPGGFLQATEAGEEELVALVLAGVGPARRVADLYAGAGAFSLRLAERAQVHAADANAAALAALERAARGTPGLRAVTTETRDLARRPLAADELAGFDAVVFDPPRAGAEAQAQALARSGVARVVAVSCDVATFARDAAILVAGGYAFERATPVDQFRHSPHVETVGLFAKPILKYAKRRRLLG